MEKMNRKMGLTMNQAVCFVRKLKLKLEKIDRKMGLMVQQVHSMQESTQEEQY